MNSVPVDYVLASAAKVLDAAAAFGGARVLLSDAELAAAERFRNPADSNGYAGAHILFRVMAAWALHLDLGGARDLPVSSECRSCGGPHGKPVISGVALSLSRVRDNVMVASAESGQLLGADLEAMVPELHADFDDFALSPKEQLLLAPADVESRLRLWVAKEAALKASGHGLAVAPGTLHLEPCVPRPAAAGWDAVVTSPELKETHGLRIAWVPAISHHLAALAVGGDPVITRRGVPEIFAGS
ncbi:4'-phosphopantetheinyl transferase family protein [Arthrobacter sp. HLT1-20]